MSILHRIRSMFRKDEQEMAEEETRMTQGERDTAEEEVEARREDLATEVGGEFGTMPPGHADFERDSERPGGGY